MLIVFLLVTLLKLVSGLPVRHSSTSSLQSLSIRADLGDANQQRSLWDILKSSFATLFACIWLSIHPNIPAPSDGEWTQRRRRLTAMLCALIVPELVFVWALRQWWAANQIAKAHKGRGWTRVHGFFVSMGGFVLTKGNRVPLDADQIVKLEARGLIKWPDISKEEIQDRSKGDFLAKSVALVQTTWFVVQCIARFQQRMTVTELELVTVAYAGLNVALYLTWWNKPLDVRSPAPVVETATKEIMQVLYGAPRDDGASETTVDDTATLSKLSIVVDSSSVSKSKPSLRLMPSPRKALHNLLRFFAWLARPFNGMLTANEIHRGANRVPTFYAPDFEKEGKNNYYIGLGLLVAMLFGVIHCVGWNFDFPTSQERFLWRLAAAYIAVAPLPFQLLGSAILRHRKTGSRRSRVFMYMSARAWYSILALYVLARFALLVLPLIAFRKLPSGAYVDLAWSQYIPHV
ncbi:unnamed protein product [Cyclocybe aegerita]|uniref:Wax synthase domain-containing protein n=1 Tax=Cyclocybe aegerita TaxID=1973307 RepID=A0A8S0VTJ1_CYCAE|nr:unnamed protein product [Cyclocybe aegerita]